MDWVISFDSQFGNDLSEVEEELNKVFLMRNSKVLSLLAIVDDFDDGYYGYLPQASDTRVRFSLSAQETKYGFSLQARPNSFRQDIGSNRPL